MITKSTFVDRLPYSCLEIKEHYTNYGDAEYWLNVTQYNGTGSVEHVVARTYCHNMASVPEEYFTLVGGDNHAFTHISKTPHGYTTYNKLRLKVQSRNYSS